MTGYQHPKHEDSQWPAAKAAYETFMAPLLRWANAERGRIASVVRLLKKTEPCLPRCSVERWLEKRPDKRRRPSLGNALLLQQACRKLGAYKKAAPTQTTTTPTTDQ